MASEHNEHTLSGKLLHLQEQLVHLIMNKTNKKIIVCLKTKHFPTIAVPYIYFSPAIF